MKYAGRIDIHVNLESAARRQALGGKLSPGLAAVIGKVARAKIHEAAAALLRGIDARHADPGVAEFHERGVDGALGHEINPRTHIYARSLKKSPLRGFRARFGREFRA